jgi:transcription elongation factor Elf1
MEEAVMHAELPEFQEREFTCPYCDKVTTVKTPMDFIFAKRVTCKHCGLDL